MLETYRTELENVRKRIAYMASCLHPGQLTVSEENQPEWQRLHSHQNELHKLIAELLRPEREAQTERELSAKRELWAKQDEAIAALPVKQRRNGWDICYDGCNYILRCPVTKAEIYKGKLNRCREVADECQPDSAV